MGWPMWGRECRKQRISRWEGVDYLELVPRRLVQSEDGPGGAQVVLLVPRYRDAVWGRLIQPRLGPGKQFVRVPLESRGSALWRAMDGQRSVRELVVVAGAAAPQDGEDLARRVCLYLQNLVENRFVAMAGPGANPSGPSAGI